MHGNSLSLIAGSVAVSLLASPVMADEPVGAQPVDPDAVNSNFTFTIGGGYLYGFSADLDGGGDMKTSRLAIDTGLGYRFADDWNLMLNFDYVLDTYDFSTPNSLDPTEPWNDINQIDTGFVLSYQIANDWTIWGGAVFDFAFESGAAFDDSFTTGGLLGVTCTVNKDLVLGGGLAVLTRIEDNVRFVPIVIINWNITDTLTLTSRTSGVWGGAAVELVWHVDPWEFAIGGVHKYSRFRLDDSGVAPDGVGEEDSIPLYGRIAYNINKDFSISVVGGASCFGNVRLEDSGGSRISDQDFDPALFLGAYLKVQF